MVMSEAYHFNEQQAPMINCNYLNATSLSDQKICMKSGLLKRFAIHCAGLLEANASAEAALDMLHIITKSSPLVFYRASVWKGKLVCRRRHI